VRSSAPRRHDWIGFAVWALAGFATSFAVISGFSIGFLVAPVAGLAIFAALRRGGEPWAGCLLGVGLAAATIGLIHIDELSCPASGERVLDGGRVIESCGSFDPVPWLLVGGLLVLGSVVVETVRPTS
jgi:hypothetical protein